MKQAFFNYKLIPNYNVENFFIGKSNESAFKILLEGKYNDNNFFLFGPNKSGKSHLSSIWLTKFDAIKYNNNLDELIATNKNILIEDVFNNIDEEKIFHIINHCNLNGLKILITSNIPISKQLFLLNDLSSRIKAFLFIKIDLPDDELLINLMIKLFHDKQIIVKNPEILNYIIKRVDRSYERVFILINQIDKLLLTKNKQLTIPLIKELI